MVTLNFAHILHALPVIAVGFLILALGFLTVKKEGVSRVSMAFMYLTLTSAAWLVFIGASYLVPKEWLFLAYQLEHLGVIFIPSAIVMFTLCIVNRWNRDRFWAYGAVALSFIFYAVFARTNLFIEGVYSYPWGYYPDYGPAGAGLFIYLALAMAFSLLLFYREHARAQSTSQKGRLKSFRNAFLWGYVAAVDLLPTFGVNVYPFGYVAAFIFMILAARAVWRYRLVDITPGFAAKQIMDTMADALVVLDADGFIRLVNQASCEMLKKTEKELLGKSLFDVSPGFLKRENFQDLLGGKLQEFESRISRGEDSSFYSVFSSTVASQKGGGVDALILIARDITHRKKMEAQYRETQKMETIGVLAGGMAADVLRQLKIVQESLLSEKPADATLQLKLATETVEKILQFTEAKAYEKKSLNPGALLSNLENWLSRYLPVTILTNVTRDNEVWNIQGNEAELESVLMNLISNAKESMPHGGRLILRTFNKYVSQTETKWGAPAGAYTVISVRDTGQGMSTELKESLFNPMFLMKRQGLEAGLGVTFVLNVVRDHKGWVDVSSELGKGTTFDLYFPAEVVGAPVK